jgi:hypothetical protein
MIPKQQRSRARNTVLVAISIFLTGALLAGIWVLTYMPK